MLNIYFSLFLLTGVTNNLAIALQDPSNIQSQSLPSKELFNGEWEGRFPLLTSPYSKTETCIARDRVILGFRQIQPKAYEITYHINRLENFLRRGYVNLGKGTVGRYHSEFRKDLGFIHKVTQFAQTKGGQFNLVLSDTSYPPTGGTYISKIVANGSISTDGKAISGTGTCTKEIKSPTEFVRLIQRFSFSLNRR